MFYVQDLGTPDHQCSGQSAYWNMCIYINIIVVCRGGRYTGMYLYRGIELIPFRYIFVRLSYRKPDTDYTVT